MWKSGQLVALFRALAPCSKPHQQHKHQCAEGIGLHHLDQDRELFKHGWYL